MNNSDFENNGDYSSEEFFSTKWTSKDWLRHVQKSEDYIKSFRNSYAQNRISGKSLEEVCQINGYSLNTQESLDDQENDTSLEPWTLLNHPIYIISFSILEFINMRLDDLMETNEMSSASLWDIAKNMYKLSKNLTLAVNSTDLGEVILAKCHYKKALNEINFALEKITNIQSFPVEKSNNIKREINIALFDLRQLCLDLSNENEIL